MSDTAGGTSVIPPSTVVLVSGGSRGLGLAVVTDLLAQGLKVAAFARTITPKLRELAEKYEGRLHVDSVDITDTAACTRFVRAAEDRLGPIDGLVNNAAIGQDSLHVHTSVEQIEKIVHTNLTAPLVLTRLVLRRMLGKGLRGRVVNITSICAQRGYAGLVAYSATKGGMDSATRTIARELNGRVLANSVAPGFFASEMSAVLGQTQLDQITRRTPTGHLTEPDEVVPVIRMLLCDQTNINGQVIEVDGGASI
ncbi:SDR family NAD(P)-dependent oxidoreductase [Plantactinospora siamensis]|uniref:SDR family NAD(P)-dependent oxidoreductase n=1 Tax=Plantactinospora siamensis TaxID=555372 RepID=A0ABV6P263_9ACTN